ncbi:Dipeptide transport system permease protein dppB [Leclercia adecarboxylata]|uniref:Dipeptide transport system permease protein dppB n=1 Tax=Leclercia adecarboxylata TaxID=83655 RepID=A0A4U9HGR8_9ENTR|nr:Dipeptide transport system permease protein dppB [Leclercia adecarboxylata]
MLQFILRRLGLVIPTFIGITLLTFAFVHMIPGDPGNDYGGRAWNFS